MYYIKKFISYILTCILVLTLSGYTFASSTQNEKFEIVTVTSDSDKATPNAVVTMTKEIVNEYPNSYSIPSRVNYSEYNSGIWWSGTLYLVSPVQYYPSTGTYRATFRGTLYGNT